MTPRCRWPLTHAGRNDQLTTLDTQQANGPSAAFSDLQIIHSDTHFTEPGDLWTSRAPSAVRDRVPRIVDVDGLPHWVFDGVNQGFASGYGTIKVDGTKVFMTEFFEMSIDDVSPAAYDPKARLALLNDIGIYAQIIYPNMAGFGGEAFASVTDAGLKQLCVEIYNDAMIEMQTDSGGRLLPMTLVPWWDIDASVAEVKRSARLGSRGIVVCTDPHVCGLSDLGEAAWNPFWDSCIDAGMPVNFHIGASNGGIRSFRGNSWPSLSVAAGNIVRGPTLFLNNAKIVLNMTMSGVLERYPELRIGLGRERCRLAALRDGGSRPPVQRGGCQRQPAAQACAVGVHPGAGVRLLRLREDPARAVRHAVGGQRDVRDRLPAPDLSAPGPPERDSGDAARHRTADPAQAFAGQCRSPLPDRSAECLRAVRTAGAAVRPRRPSRCGRANA
jgi:predicted TIM-barrel fold metal-dependent hydrolase